MSSSYVRTQIKTFLDDNSNEDYVDLTAQFGEISQLLAEESIQPDAPWLGLQFAGGDEVPVGLAATNDQGLYRETGIIQLHVVAEAAIGVGDGLLIRGEALRNLFRGRRIGNITIESVSPLNFDLGSTLEFEGGWMSGTCIMSYICDLNL